LWTVDSVTRAPADVVRAAATAIAAVAEFEAARRSQRTAAGVAAAKRRGRAVGQAPYGTRWVGPDGGRPRATIDERTGKRRTHRAHLVAVSEELAVLRRALDVYAKCGRWDLTAAALAAEGLRPRRGAKWIAWKLARACRNPRALAFLEDRA
jgi:DNA invertase Pin-like site-specific DNA recombinase